MKYPENSSEVQLSVIVLTNRSLSLDKSVNKETGTECIRLHEQVHRPSEIQIQQFTNEKNFGQCTNKNVKKMWSPLSSLNMSLQV